MLFGFNLFHIQQIRVSTKKQLDNIFQSSISQPPLVIDLSLGAMIAHKAAKDTYNQLGLDFPVPKQNKSSSIILSTDKYANIASQGVDSEARGDIAISDAYAYASTAAPHIQQNVYIVNALFDRNIDEADHAFVYFLSRLTNANNFIIINIDPPENVNNLQKSTADKALDKLYTLVPGLISGDQAKVLVSSQKPSLYSLNNGLFLIDPFARKPPLTIDCECYDWLSIKTSAFYDLHLYSQMFCSEGVANKNVLARHADTLYIQGHVELALAAVERLMALTHDLEQLLWLVRLQGMRIGKCQFKQAASQTIPEKLEDKGFQSFLWMTRGWGLIMTGQTAEANECFSMADKLNQHVSDASENLYFLNITALGKVRAGDFSAAETIEKRIEKCLEKSEHIDWALKYINSINLHRLMRYQKRYKEAEDYLDSALETIDGTQTENDAIYAEYNRWKLASCQDKEKQALIHGLRCAMLLLASDVPESLASRTVAGLIGIPWPIKETWNLPVVEDAVCIFLSKTFKALYERDSKHELVAHVELPPDSQFTKRRFFSSNTLEMSDLTEVRAVGGEGYGFIIANYIDRNHELRCCFPKLQHLVINLLNYLGYQIGITHVIILDNRFGRGIPATLSELAEVATRHDCKLIEYNEKKYRLNNKRFGCLNDALMAKLSPAVSDIEPSGLVKFKRFLDEKVIGGDDMTLIAQLIDAEVKLDGFNATMTETDTYRALRLLQADHIVSLNVALEALELI